MEEQKGLDQLKNYSRDEDNNRTHWNDKVEIYLSIHIYLIKNSYSSLYQTYRLTYFFIYLPKEEMDSHALDKWLIRGSNHSQGNQSQSSKHPYKLSWLGMSTRCKGVS